MSDVIVCVVFALFLVVAHSAHQQPHCDGALVLSWGKDVKWVCVPGKILEKVEQNDE
jgi:hypothetical protein